MCVLGDRDEHPWPAASSALILHEAVEAGKEALRPERCAPGDVTDQPSVLDGVCEGAEAPRTHHALSTERRGPTTGQGKPGSAPHRGISVWKGRTREEPLWCWPGAV